MIHPLISAAAKDGDFRANAMREIVPRHFDDIARYGRFFEDPEGSSDFIRIATACAVEASDPLSAFAALRGYDEGATGSSFDAFDGAFRSFGFALAAHIAGLADRVGWKGPVAKPRLVEIDFGGGITSFVAVQPPVLLPYGMCLAALMEDGRPDRVESGSVDWNPMAWHSIRSLGSQRIGFDPDLAGAMDFAARWVAGLAAIHEHRIPPEEDDFDDVFSDLARKSKAIGAGEPVLPV